MEDLKSIYQVSRFDVLISAIVHATRKRKIPNCITKLSKKKYRRYDILQRYYTHKYFNVSVGKYSYGYRQLIRKNSKLASIGAFCSIANNVSLAVGNHTTNYITTSPILNDNFFGFNPKKGIKCNTKNGAITIGNDVWIGTNVTILPSVHIGNGAIVGAGAVVTKDVPDYAVVVGVPARVLKYRFLQEEIDALNRICWWDWPDEKIRENLHLMYNPQEFIAKFDPKHQKHQTEIRENEVLTI